MNKRLELMSLFTPALLLLCGCGAIDGLFDPFLRKWESGIFELDFKPDKSFKLIIGRTISVNLDDRYSRTTIRSHWTSMETVTQLSHTNLERAGRCW